MYSKYKNYKINKKWEKKNAIYIVKRAGTQILTFECKKSNFSPNNDTVIIVKQILIYHKIMIEYK